MICENKKVSRVIYILDECIHIFFFSSLEFYLEIQSSKYFLLFSQIINQKRNDKILKRLEGNMENCIKKN